LTRSPSATGTSSNLPGTEATPAFVDQNVELVCDLGDGAGHPIDGVFGRDVDRECHWLACASRINATVSSAPSRLISAQITLAA